MNYISTMLAMLDFKHKMNEEEKDALLSELIGSYITDRQCYLMNFLLKKDFKGFQNYVKNMCKKGISIKECIQKYQDTQMNENV